MALCRTCSRLIPCHCHTIPPAQIRPSVYQTIEPTRSEDTMTRRKPSKPWRVTVTGPEVKATASFTSEAKAYAFVRACLGGDSPADTAKVEQWEGGRWWHFETVTADEIRAAQLASRNEK